MRQKIEVRAYRNVFRNVIELMAIHELGGGFIGMGQPIAFNKVNQDECMIEPTLSLRMEDAQLLMDELWRCGIRPTEGTGSAGSLAATERHLADMQKIAFHFIEPKP